MLQRLAAQLRFARASRDHLVEAQVGELAAGDVDGHRHVVGDQPRLVPGRELRARAVEDELAERPDQPGLLGDRDELGGGDARAVGLGPARERLEAGDAACS